MFQAFEPDEDAGLLCTLSASDTSDRPVCFRQHASDRLFQRFILLGLQEDTVTGPLQTTGIT